LNHADDGLDFRYEASAEGRDRGGTISRQRSASPIGIGRFWIFPPRKARRDSGSPSLA
jgi:hypothetical protein